MYDLIVFDVDGTLIDSRYTVCKALQNIIYRNSPARPTLDELAYAFGYNGKKVMDDFHLPHRLIRDWVDEEMVLADKSRPFAGIAELIGQLRQRGISLGIATSKFRQELRPFLEPWQLLEAFRYTVCFDDVQELKPDPESLDILSRISGVPKDNMLFVGDAPSDLACAENAGVDFALACWDPGNTTSIACPTSLHRPEELLALLS